MQDSSQDLPQPTDTVDVLMELDKRLDAVEGRISTVEGAVSSAKKPWFRRGGFLGSAAGVLIVIGGWLSGLWMDEPEIPRIVHSNLLLSDRALALTLARGRGDPDRVSPLNTEIHEQVKAHLQNDEATKTYLFDIAAAQGVLTYSGSHTYLKHYVPFGSVACLMLSDPDMRDLLLASSDAAPRAVRDKTRACTTAQSATAGRTIGFSDFSPLVVPFQASAGDTVEISVRVLAQRPDPAGFVEYSKGHELFEAVLFPDTPITFDPPVHTNIVQAKVDVPQGRDRHQIAVYLNEAGEEKVDSDKNPNLDRDQEFVVSLFVTVKVIPEAKL